jgi:CubicO group peptidase (beta-lactamase class C family)
MLMVEAGELGLDDLVADHLPGDLRFDTNGATFRDLLGHRSGIPDYSACWTSRPTTCGSGSRPRS